MSKEKASSEAGSHYLPDEQTKVSNIDWQAAVQLRHEAVWTPSQHIAESIRHMQIAYKLLREQIAAQLL